MDAPRLRQLLDPKNDFQIESLPAEDLRALMATQARLLKISEEAILRHYVRDARRRVLFGLIPRKVFSRSSQGRYRLQKEIAREIAERLDKDQATVEESGLDGLIRDLAKDLTTRRRLLTSDVLQIALKRSPFCGLCGYRFTSDDLHGISYKDLLPARVDVPERVDEMKPLWADLQLRRPQIDHALPVSSFGSNAPDNLELLCAMCNRGKSDYLSYSEMRASSGYRSGDGLSLRALAARGDIQLVVAVLLRDRCCTKCGATPPQSELTLRPRDESRLTLFDNLVTTCYTCALPS